MKATAYVLAGMCLAFILATAVTLDVHHDVLTWLGR